MNFEIIERIVDLIEENYNKEITKECIEKATQKSYGYSRNEFKKITSMALDKYRIRRQLSLIIKNIKDSESKLYEHNLEPWSGRNSFYQAFVKEFGIPPMKFIKEYDEGKLQSKMDVGYLKDKYKEDGETIERLIRSYGNKENALKYLLSLGPYVFDGLGFLFLRSGADLEELLIRHKYATSIVGDRYYIKDIPKEYYKTHSKILNEYYDLGTEIYIKHNDPNNNKIPLTGCIMVRRSIINRLAAEIDIKDILNTEVSPSMLRTLWYEEAKLEKVAEGFVKMPNELIFSEFSQMRTEVLRNIVFQEQELKLYNSMEDLRKDVKFDYDRFIDNQKELCNKCEYSEICQDDYECRYYEELSKEEQEMWLSKPDYEPLSIEKLLSEIRALLLEGLLYLDKQIMID